MVDDISLDDYEREIEDSLDVNNIQRVPNLKDEISVAKQAASGYVKKSERISVRLTPADLEAIKVSALEEGIPYQTLVGSILHKFATGRLVDIRRKSD